MVLLDLQMWWAETLKWAEMGDGPPSVEGGSGALRCQSTRPTVLLGKIRWLGRLGNLVLFLGWCLILALSNGLWPMQSHCHGVRVGEPERWGGGAQGTPCTCSWMPGAWGSA